MNIQIRKMIPDDYPSLHRLLSDSRVMKYLEAPFSKEQTKRFLAEAGLGDPPLIYSIEAEKQFIGYVIYHAYDDDSVEIGWVILPEYWGKGYASEATCMMIKRAKRDGKHVIIECDPRQAVSKHIAQKYGFAYMGNVAGLDIFRLDE